MHMPGKAKVKPSRSANKNYLSIWTDVNTQNDGSLLYRVYGLDQHNKVELLLKYVDMPTLALSKGMTIIEDFTDKGLVKRGTYVKEVKVVTKETGSCRGVHVNDKDCYDASASVKVVVGS
jgi:hypothetical protein